MSNPTFDGTRSVQLLTDGRRARWRLGRGGWRSCRRREVPRATAGEQSETQKGAAGVADFAGPAEGGLGLALGVLFSGVARVNRKASQELHSTTQLAKARMMSE